MTVDHHRGFGFITLEHVDKVLEVILAQPHFINGKKLDCKIAIPKERLTAMTKDVNTARSKRNHNNNKIKRVFTSVISNQPCSPVDNFQNNTNTTYNTPVHNYEPNECDDGNNNTYSQHIQKHLHYISSNAPSSPVHISNSSFTSSSAHFHKSSLLYLRKLFVGGLPPQLTTKALISYFSKFGPVEKGIIMTDILTGRTRGFGFLIFTHKETVDKIISISNCYYLCGKWIECKRAYPKEQQVEMLSESNTDPGLSANYNNDNEHLALNDVLSSKSQSLSGSECSNESHLCMFQNYIPKSQIKSNVNSNKSNESSIDQQNQVININISNNCINNPSCHHYFHYKLFDIHGEDLSKLTLYKNSHKATLFQEEQDNENTIANGNSNITYSTGCMETNNAQSNSSTTLYQIHKQPIDYVHYDRTKHMSNQVDNQSLIGNYFVSNPNTSNTSSKCINTNGNNNLVANYYSNISSTCNDNPNLLELIVPADISNTKTHQQPILLNDIDNTNTTMNISNNDVDVSSDFVEENDGSFGDDDCYGPNIQKRKPYRRNSSGGSYRPY